MDDKEKILNFHRSLAEFVSKDEKTAEEYLESESINFEEISKDNLSQIYGRLSNYKLSKGATQRSKFQKKFEKFVEIVRGKVIDEIQALYPSIPKIAYRKFEEENIDKTEIDDLMKDASFLQFLDSEIDDDSE